MGTNGHGEQDRRPHSRACGISCPGHGTSCHASCPTCGGKAEAATEPTSDWGRGSWMQLSSGKRFFPLDPRPEDVDPTDIGHALSQICRYGGHTKRFYSVAEHTVIVSKWLAVQGESPELQLRGLLHDAAEAYVGDMVRPLKHHMPEYRRLEDRVLDVIGETFELGQLSVLPQRVREADNRILLDERARLLSSPTHAWEQDGLEPLGVYIHGHQPADAERAWMTRLGELQTAIG